MCAFVCVCVCVKGSAVDTTEKRPGEIVSALCSE
jgi:hypothetical protein